MDSSPTRSIVFRAVRARRRWLQPKEHAALGLAGATSVVAPAIRSEWECPRSASSTSLPDTGAALPAVAAVGAKFRPLRGWGRLGCPGQCGLPTFPVAGKDRTEEHQ